MLEYFIKILKKIEYNFLFNLLKTNKCFQNKCFFKQSLTNNNINLI